MKTVNLNKAITPNTTHKFFKHTTLATSIFVALSATAWANEHANNQQYALEWINKARLDPDAYAVSLGISLNEGLAANTISTAAKQPLAGDTRLQTAAAGHNAWLFSNNVFSHTGANNSSPSSRATAAGYTWTNVGENLAASSDSSQTLITYSKQAIENLFVDEGVAGRGHRTNMMNSSFREIGIGDGIGAWSGYGNGVVYDSTYIHTELFGTTNSTPLITGVVYNDTNNDEFYTPGEGISGEGINIGTGPVTSTSAAGAYDVAASAGTNTLNFNGGATVNVTVGTNNVKVDRVGTEIHSSGDTTLVLGANTLKLLGVANLNGTGSVADETLIGNRSANILIGTGGNDRLEGRAGSDTYSYPSNNFGHDVIEEGTGHDNTANTIQFGALTCTNLTYARNSNDLVIKSNTDNTVTVKNYYILTPTYILKDNTNASCTPNTSTNRAPTASNDTANTTPGTAVIISNALANDTDPDGNTLTITANTNPTKGSITRSGNSFTYTPNAGISNTTDTFTYTVSDGNGGTATATVTVTIGGATNRAPTAGNDTANTTPGTAVTISNALANDSDLDGDTLTVTSNTNPTKGSVTRSGNSFTYTPNAGISNTTDSFNYTISDGKGGTATATITITIGATAQTIDAVNDDIPPTNFNTPVEFNVVSNDTNPAGGARTIKTYTRPPSTAGTLTLTTTGTNLGKAKFTPKKGYSGTTSFTYTLRDSKGATDTATVTITVKLGVPPTPVDDTASTKYGTPVPFNVLANDGTPKPTITSNTTPAKGTLRVNKTSGDITYTPKKSTSGTDTFTYTVINAAGLTASANVTIEVATNNAPVAQYRAYDVPFGKARTLDKMALHTSDIDGDAILANSVVTQPTKGTVKISAGKFIYTPKRGALGEDFFTYTVKDIHGAVSNVGNIRINITTTPNTSS